MLTKKHSFWEKSPRPPTGLLPLDPTQGLPSPDPLGTPFAHSKYAIGQCISHSISVAVIEQHNLMPAKSGNTLPSFGGSNHK